MVILFSIPPEKGHDLTVPVTVTSTPQNRTSPPPCQAWATRPSLRVGKPKRVRIQLGMDPPPVLVISHPVPVPVPSSPSIPSQRPPPPTARQIDPTLTLHSPLSPQHDLPRHNPASPRRGRHHRRRGQCAHRAEDRRRGGGEGVLESGVRVCGTDGQDRLRQCWQRGEPPFPPLFSPSLSPTPRRLLYTRLVPIS